MISTDARMTCKDASATPYRRACAADWLIRHGDVTDKTFGLMVKSSIVAEVRSEIQAAPIASPQEAINERTMAGEYRSAAKRWLNAALPWVAAAAIAIVALAAAAEAPAKLRADLRLYEQFEAMK